MQKQLLVGCREQLRIKDTEFELKVLHSFTNANWNQKNKKLLFQSIKNVYLRENRQKCPIYFCVSRKFLKCVRVRQGAFLSEDWKFYPSETVSSLQLLALEMRGRKAYRKQTSSNVSVLLNKVSALEQDRFKQVSLYTASWLFANTLV